MNYEVDIAGMKRSLKLFKVSDDLQIAAFILYGADKHKAKAKQWRIRESTLLGTGLLGGGLGALLGMRVFRHKTKHWYFHVINWFAALLHLAVLFWFEVKKSGA